MKSCYRKYTANLCLVLASTALEVVAAEVCDGNQSTEIANVDTVWVADLKQPLAQELRCAVCYLTVAFHLSKTQATVPTHTWHSGRTSVFDRQTFIIIIIIIRFV